MPAVVEAAEEVAVATRDYRPEGITWAQASGDSAS